MEIYVALRSQILVCIGRVYNVVHALYAYTSVAESRERDLVGNRISSDCYTHTHIYIYSTYGVSYIYTYIVYLTFVVICHVKLRSREGWRGSCGLRSRVCSIKYYIRIIIDVHDECTGDVYACYRSGVCVDKKGLTDTSPETVRYIINNVRV